MEQELLVRLPLLTNNTAHGEFKVKTAQMRQKIADEEEPGKRIRLDLLGTTLAKYEGFEIAQAVQKRAG